MGGVEWAHEREIGTIFAAENAEGRKHGISARNFTAAVHDTPDSGGWIEIFDKGALLTLNAKTGWREVEIGRGSKERPARARTRTMAALCQDRLVKCFLEK
ncbi:MAG: hypothetical protein ABJP08_22215 [Roseibium sp.]